MSCLGPDYNPKPTREWYRFENRCSTTAFNPQIDINTLITPGNSISNAIKYQLDVYKKGNILQYKKNSANLTKNQRYAQIAKGMWTNRTKTWSSQSEVTSNPNSDMLKRVNYKNKIIQNYSVNGTEIIQPRLCPVIPTTDTQPLPIPSNTPNTNPVLPPANDAPPPPPPFILPPYVDKPTIIYPVEIQDGGTLIGPVVENPCTGQILDRTYTQDCYPTTDSDVPGPIKFLCWNDGMQTYYPKTKLTYGTSGNKWPTNAKLIFSANSKKLFD